MKTSESTISKSQYNKDFYRDKRVLVLGGLGFMGLNLVRELTSLGSAVTIVDLDANSGRALNVPHACRIYYADRCEKKLIDREIHTADVIFNLAGRSGVTDSFKHPRENLVGNCLQHLDILQVCREYNLGAVVVFPSSCLVYGEIPGAMLLPIHESNRVILANPYAIHKYTCEMYSRLYQETYGIPTAILRISNPIGPYQYRIDGSYGVYNQFIYLATQDRDITVYGEGSHLRDIISIDDVVQAFLYCASAANIVDVVNVGRGVGTTLCNYAQLVVDIIGSGRVTHVDWPNNITPSVDFVADISHICSMTNWKPDIDLSAAIIAAAKFYRWADNNSLIGNGERK